ncbi:MAG: hypothetical protein ACE5FF_14685 [Saprospiraceae bacterium]
MKTTFLISKHLFLVGLLTLFTQIGGLVWLLNLPLFAWLNRKYKAGWRRLLAKTGLFISTYLLATFLIVPPLANRFCGRVPLPIWSNDNLRPHSVTYYCLLNHHYVKPELKAAAESVAERISKKYPGTVLCYLDANFPFINGYPLEPHFSHRDGKKLDVALHWKGAKTEMPIFGTPSFYGYGACALPLPGEIDMEPECRKKGNWYRSFEKDLAEKFYENEDFIFDETRSEEMIRLFAHEKGVRKILLEPHLKRRLGLKGYDKIRFQGCKAARHDDHIHIQVR